MKSLYLSFSNLPAKLKKKKKTIRNSVEATYDLHPF